MGVLRLDEVSGTFDVSSDDRGVGAAPQAALYRTDPCKATANFK